jgi:hypothetical protein
MIICKTAANAVAAPGRDVNARMARLDSHRRTLTTNSVALHCHKPAISCSSLLRFACHRCKSASAWLCPCCHANCWLETAAAAYTASATNSRLSAAQCTQLWLLLLQVKANAAAAAADVAVSLGLPRCARPCIATASSSRKLQASQAPQH